MFKIFTICLTLVFISYSELICQKKDEAISVSSFTLNEDDSVSELVLESVEKKVAVYRTARTKATDDTQFLKKLFFGIQRDHLQNYKNNVPLASIFTDKGSYDCLTGTAMYALVLDVLGIDYSIRETDFHVYLIAHLNQKDVLLEATDPIYGFIENPVIINNKIKLYRDGESASASFIRAQPNDNSLTIPYRIDRVISLANLAGLQYYNLALKAFEKGNYSKSEQLMNLAISLYPNDRFYGFRQIVQIEAAQPVSAIYSNE